VSSSGSYLCGSRWPSSPASAWALAAPGLFEVVARFEWARVNLVVAVLIWLMIYPMMLKVEPSCLADVGRKAQGARAHPRRQLAHQAVHHGRPGRAVLPARLRRPRPAAEDAQQYIAGMILLGVAPCTAMVFVWSHLTDGDANYTLVQVSVNDIILVFAFAPIAGLLLGVTDLHRAVGDARRLGRDLRRHPARRRVLTHVG
jgi:ACR3 family arsenite transporter